MEREQVPCRAPPLPEEALQAMVGYSIFKHECDFAISLLVGYFGILRTGEILALNSSHISVESERGPAVISLGMTKGGQRQGAAESVALTAEQPIRWLWAWSRKCPDHQPLCSTPAHRRKQFNDNLKAVGFEGHGFRPYSLRRGGATYWFKKWGTPLDRLLLYGRWQNAKTARTYVNDGLFVLASMQLRWTPASRRFRHIYQNSCKAPLPTLVPALKSRTGGGGKKKRDVKKPAKVSRF